LVGLSPFTTPARRGNSHGTSLLPAPERTCQIANRRKFQKVFKSANHPMANALLLETVAKLADLAGRLDRVEEHSRQLERGGNLVLYGLPLCPTQLELQSTIATALSTATG
jgi:hypothetical protein